MISKYIRILKGRPQDYKEKSDLTLLFIFMINHF